NTYWSWSQQLPFKPGPDFISFIQGPGALSQKLRERWLYELARTKDWANYAQYYQYSNDLTLICYYQIAQYNLGQQKQVAQTVVDLWLSGDNRPPVCNALFDLLLKDGSFSQDLITKRIALALEKRNIGLAQSLLKQYQPPHTKELQTLNAIVQNPARINQLSTGELADEFYLYGLKRLVSTNMKQAVTYWNAPKTKRILNEAEQQAFLTHLTLYKAMRNSEDALSWFSQIKPQYYTEILVDWQIRFALKNRDWNQVNILINNSSNKDSPCWQYWLARSLEEQGKKAEALAIYEPLSRSRQYYGFLASIRLNKTPSFENEKPTSNLDTIKAYKPFIDQVKNLYTSKQSLQASRMLNDFISELPKDEASALVYWVDSELQWHGKSVYLSNNDILNNQLSLRFPLAYQDAIKQYSKHYAVPPEFVYAIIRQESGFREDVTSSAGARGLMQVMPRTASLVSKADKIPYQDQRQLFISQKNINIGIAYLKQLGKRFSNHPVLIAAAYNAGPKQVVYWLKTHPPKEIDVWIETLPWQETRNYLKNVMAFYVVYQYRLNQKPNLEHFLEPL
ncbi:MAG: transglycosylase SLT domain-containing protein, partial [Legionella sp.]